MSSHKEMFQSFSNNQLLDICCNYIEYGYSKEIREEAKEILDSRGVPESELEAALARLNTEKSDHRFKDEQVKLISRKYIKFSLFSLFFYIFNLILALVFLVLHINVVFVLPVSFLFISFHIASILQYMELDYLIGEKEFHPVVQFLFLYICVIPFSPIFSLMNIVKINKKIKEIDSK